MGVQFPDLKTFENTAAGIGTNMFEGFQPTVETVTIIRDLVTGKIQIKDLKQLIEKLHYD
jgi:hypothetical protein